jgi:hypothetical protein
VAAFDLENDSSAIREKDQKIDLYVPVACVGEPYVAKQ